MPRKPTPEFVDRWVEQEEASGVTGINERGLENDRQRGDLGIPYYKFGYRVRYRLSELIEWAETKRVTPPGYETPAEALERPEIPRRGGV
jgi:hypothetical protein